MEEWCQNQTAMKPFEKAETFIVLVGCWQ